MAATVDFVAEWGRFTDEGGTEYFTDRRDGLLSVTDLNRNKLSIDSTWPASNHLKLAGDPADRSQ